MSPHLYLFKDRTTPYNEELAYHCCQKSTNESLKPLPPPPEKDPSPPEDKTVRWIYDKKTRVYLGDFTDVEQIPEEHKQFLGELLELDHISVVCEGLFPQPPRSHQKLLDELELGFEDETYSKFQRGDLIAWKRMVLGM